MLSAKIEWNYNNQSGSQELAQAAIGKLEGGLRDLTPFLRRVVQQVLPLEIHKQFESEGAYGTEPWAPLTRTTIRLRGGEAHPILRMRGILERSFMPGEAHHIENIAPQEAEFGSDVKYALFHQTGTGEGFDDPSYEPPASRNHRRAGGKGMPQRQIIFWSERMKQLIDDELKAYIAKLGAEAGMRPAAEQLPLSL